MVPVEITTWITKTYPKPKIDPEWLQACYDYIVNEEHLDPRMEMETIKQNIEMQLLSSDLCDSMLQGTGFPANIAQSTNLKLKGPPMLVEIVTITEIGHSAFQLLNVRQAQIDQEDLAGLAAQEDPENGEGNPGPSLSAEEGPIPKYPRSMLKFEISDGTIVIPAVEYRPIREFELSTTPAGFKLLLKDVLIRRGIAFLEPKNIILKGHLSDEREANRDRDFVRGLYRRLGRPDPYVHPDSPTDENAFQAQNQAPENDTLISTANTNDRSPLVALPSPREADATMVDIGDDEDLPRKRRIPNTSTQTSTPAFGTAITAAATATTMLNSNTSTLVASPYFGNSASGSGNGTGIMSAPTNSITQQFSRGYLSPVRGDNPIVNDDMEDIEEIDENDFTSISIQSRGNSHNQTQLHNQNRNRNGTDGGAQGTAAKSRPHAPSSDYGDFGDDVDIDDAFLEELAQVEAQAQALSQPHSQEPVPVYPQAQVPSISQLQSQSRELSQSSSSSAGGGGGGKSSTSYRSFDSSRVHNLDVITIEDEDEEDKENRPVMARRVRRRRNTNHDEYVIDISD